MSGGQRAVCNVCKGLGREPFAVPAPIDSIGAELLRAHLDEHRRNGELDPAAAGDRRCVVRAAVVVLAAVAWVGSQVVSPVPLTAGWVIGPALAAVLVADRVWAWTGGAS